MKIQIKKMSGGTIAAACRDSYDKHLMRGF